MTAEEIYEFLVNHKQMIDENNKESSIDENNKESSFDIHVGEDDTISQLYAVDKLSLVI